MEAEGQTGQKRLQKAVLAVRFILRLSHALDVEFPKGKALNHETIHGSAVTTLDASSSTNDASSANDTDELNVPIDSKTHGQEVVVSDEDSEDLPYKHFHINAIATVPKPRTMSSKPAPIQRTEQVGPMQWLTAFFSVQKPNRSCFG